MENQPTHQRVFGSQESLGVKGIAIIMLICHHCFLGSARYKVRPLRLSFQKTYGIMLLSFSKSVYVFLHLSVPMELHGK